MKILNFLIYLVICTLHLPIDVVGKNFDRDYGVFSRQILADLEKIAVETGKSFSSHVSGGEQRRLTMVLAEKQFVGLAVKQFGADLKISVLAPDGKILTQTDSPLGAFSTERLWLIAPIAGDYILQIQSGAEAGIAGEFEVKILQTRPADEKAAASVQASALAEEAFKSQEQRTAAGFSAALVKYAEAIKQAQKAEDADAELMPRVWTALIFALASQPEPAAAQNQKALALAQKLADSRIEAQILYQFGLIYQESDPARAADSLHKSIELLDRLGAKTEVTQNLVTLAGLNTRNGNYQKAFEQFDRAIKIYRETNNRVGEAAALTGKATVYSMMGEQAQAVENYLPALEIFRQAKVAYYEDILLSNIGQSYQQLGEQQKAFEYFNDALALARRNGNRRAEAFALGNIGSVYLRLGNFDSAAEYISQALTISRELKINETAAFINNLGTLSERRSQPDEALKYYTEAAALAHEIKRPVIEATALYNIAGIYSQRGEHEKARQAVEKSLVIRRALPNQTDQALSLSLLAQTLDRLGKSVEASTLFAESLALMRTEKNPWAESTVLYRVALSEAENNRLSDAKIHIDEAISVIESVRARVVAPELRASYLAETGDYYELRTEILMSLDRVNPGQNYDARALESAENAKARSLVELLNESPEEIESGVPEKIKLANNELRRSISAKALKQAQLVTDEKATPAQKNAIAAELARLAEDYNTLEAAARESNPKYAALISPAPMSLREIQTKILDPNTVLLEYALGDDRSYLWAIGQNFIKSYQLPARLEIETAARKVYELTTAVRDQNSAVSSAKNSASLKTALADLSRKILLPAINDFRGKRVVIVADGALQYVPFAALPIDKANAPLVAANEIIALPSAGTLPLLRRERSRKKPADSIAVVADPVFGIDDERIAASAKSKAIGEKLPTIAALKTDARRAADDVNLLNFPRLRFSRNEAENLLQIAGKQNAVEITDFAASKDAVLSGKLGRARVVHLATHGIINSQNPNLSGIVLSLVNQEGEPQDGFLRLYDIFNLSLNADLVVLSACRTALGKNVRGEGLVGLTRGFMYAGSPRVVATLWSIDDRATSELMAIFYRKMLKENMPPAAALQAAQNELRRNPRWREPFYWAAFTLQGDWR